MHLIFCMAGLYQRFKSAGYDTPKYLLKFDDQSNILEAVFLHFSHYNEAFKSVSLIVNRRDINSRPKIDAALQKYFGSIPNYIVFANDTKGQAETAKIAIENLKRMNSKKNLYGQCSDRKVLIHNIDTILLDRNFFKISALLDQKDGVIDIFHSESPQFSYIETNIDGCIKRIVEKQVISNKATSGLYCFRDYEKYLEYFSKIEKFSSRELYISDVYKAMIDCGKSLIEFSSSTQADKNTIVLGTPEEYEAFIGKSFE